MPIEIRLPPLGDQIDSGDVLEVKVQVGSIIAKDQGIVELETDKATVEIPSPHAGKVLKVHVSDGQTVKIGASLITLEAVESPAPSAGPTGSSPVTQRETPLDLRNPVRPHQPPPKSPPAAGSPPANRAPAVAPPRTLEPAVPKGPLASEPGPTAVNGSEPATKSTDRVTEESLTAQSSSPAYGVRPATQEGPAKQGPATQSTGISAGPAVRRFAREVGVDLAQVTGSGDGGRITRDDVLSAVRLANEVARDRMTSAPATSTAARPGETDAWGTIRFEKLTKIRKTIAAKMSESWSTVPRVTNFDDADVTELERIRQSSKQDYAAQGIKLTSLPFVAKAVAMALKKHPVVNAMYDSENDRIVFKEYVNLGIAVDTDRGLVVPALRQADRMSISQIARELANIADKVKTAQFTVEDLRGTTFTISNLGAIGGTYSTPIVNIPEVAILLVGRSRQLPVVVNDQVAIRLMMPLSLSYDHRLVDGSAAARFLNDVIGFLAAPSRLLLAP